MTPRRLVTGILTAVVLEVVVFGLAHRDLLWLNKPLAELRAASLDVATEQVASALARERLTRRQLEVLAAATADRPDLRAEFVQALERLHALDPRDVHVRLRLAEAYRLAGRLDEARALFAAVLEETSR